MINFNFGLKPTGYFIQEATFITNRFIAGNVLALFGAAVDIEQFKTLADPVALATKYPNRVNITGSTVTIAGAVLLMSTPSTVKTILVAAVALFGAFVGYVATRRERAVRPLVTACTVGLGIWLGKVLANTYLPTQPGVYLLGRGC